MSMFWEIRQQAQIADAQSAALTAEAKAGQTREYIRMLEARVDKMQLACQAMWEIMRDLANLTDEKLMAKVQEIDLRDGKLDGKMGAASGVNCASCQRTINPRHARCLYCGVDVAKRHSFNL